MKRILLIVLAVTLAGGAAQAHTDTPKKASSERATAKDYRELARMLGKLRSTVTELATLVGDGWQPECRGYSPEKTVRCAAAKFDTSAEQAVACWQDESNFGIEPPHTDSYHGPFQFSISTYQSQQASMPDVVRWYELSPAVHDVRSNILTAVAWASRHGYGPWTAPGCA